VTTVVLTGLGAALALILVRRRWFVVRVAGHSMSPTYVDGERVLFRWVRPGGCAVGDCVAFTPLWSDGDPRWLIKRVAAAAGDALPEAFRAATGVTDAVVPPGCLVVLGDNPESLDSRHFGYLPAANVVGVAARPRSPTTG
jgi:signal peptidase I